MCMCVCCVVDITAYVSHRNVSGSSISHEDNCRAASSHMSPHMNVLVTGLRVSVFKLKFLSLTYGELGRFGQ